jgi:hypothetical protein
MILQKDEYRIKDDGIWISKKALEEFRAHLLPLQKKRVAYLSWIYQILICGIILVKEM